MMTGGGKGAAAFPIHFACIIFAEVLDPNGRNLKTRRVVVLAPDSALAAGFPIVVAVVISPNEIRGRSGFVPPAYMLAVNARTAAKAKAIGERPCSSWSATFAQFAFGFKLAEPGNGGNDAVVSSMAGTSFRAASRTASEASLLAISARRFCTRGVA
jgi:hypothetical protein